MERRVLQRNAAAKCRCEVPPRGAAAKCCCLCDPAVMRVWIWDADGMWHALRHKRTRRAAPPLRPHPFASARAALQDFLMSVIVHAADISNPAKPLPTYLDWTDRVLAEFYSQVPTPENPNFEPLPRPNPNPSHVRESNPSHVPAGLDW
eukprot:2735947-Prymnesium_polylepis.1